MSNTSAMALPAVTPHYTSERALLDHLHLMAELPYPSWAMMPSLMPLARRHVEGPVVNFVWIERDSLKPLALWVDPVNDAAYCNCIANFSEVIEHLLPAPVMIASRGRAVRVVEDSPGYEQTLMYTQVMTPYDLHWGMSIPVYLSDSGLGFMSICRSKQAGRYREEEWARWDRIGAALRPLDRTLNPWNELPDAGYREACNTTLWLNREGRILAQGDAARNILFLARRTGMGAPDWARPDWYALPPEVRTAVQTLFADENARRSELSLNFAWGHFDFVLEKMSANFVHPEPTVSIALRHHEPLDIALARSLWGWPLSPKEKRILIASTRNPGLAQLARLLDMTVGTLKTYINKMMIRLDADSRQQIIQHVISAPGCAENRR